MIIARVYEQAAGEVEATVAGAEVLRVPGSEFTVGRDYLAILRFDGKSSAETNALVLGFDLNGSSIASQIFHTDNMSGGEADQADYRGPYSWFNKFTYTAGDLSVTCFDSGFVSPSTPPRHSVEYAKILVIDVTDLQAPTSDFNLTFDNTTDANIAVNTDVFKRILVLNDPAGGPFDYWTGFFTMAGNQQNNHVIGPVVEDTFFPAQIRKTAQTARVQKASQGSGDFFHNVPIYSFFNGTRTFQIGIRAGNGSSPDYRGLGGFYINMRAVGPNYAGADDSNSAVIGGVFELRQSLPRPDPTVARRFLVFANINFEHFDIGDAMGLRVRTGGSTILDSTQGRSLTDPNAYWAGHADGTAVQGPEENISAIDFSIVELPAGQPGDTFDLEVVSDTGNVLNNSSFMVMEVLANPLATPVTVTVPVDGATEIQTDQILSWTPTNAVSYNLYFSDNRDDVLVSEPSTLVLENSIISSFAPTLVPGRTYYFRVDALNADGNPAPSEIFEFTTIALPAISINGITPEAVSNPGERVELFGNFAEQNTASRFFDVFVVVPGIGEVPVLTGDNQPAGRVRAGQSSIVFFAPDLSPGTYDIVGRRADLGIDFSATGGLVVGPPNFASTTLGMKNLFPPIYGMGARELALVGDIVPFGDPPTAPTVAYDSGTNTVTVTSDFSLAVAEIFVEGVSVGTATVLDGTATRVIESPSGGDEITATVRNPSGTSPLSAPVVV